MIKNSINLLYILKKFCLRNWPNFRVIRLFADYWPKRKNGLQSTSGTTATVALLRGRRLYVAQLGDSGLVLARRNKETGSVNAHYVTPEHKPDSEEEKRR